MKHLEKELEKSVGEIIIDLQREIRELEEENKKLKSDLAYERTMLDNVKAEYESLQNVVKKLKEELDKYKKQYEHSMDIGEITSIQDGPITWKKDSMGRWYSEGELPIVLC